jgi:protease IV
MNEPRSEPNPIGGNDPGVPAPGGGFPPPPAPGPEPAGRESPFRGFPPPTPAPAAKAAGASPLPWIGMIVALVLLAGSAFLNVALVMAIAVQGMPAGGTNLAEKRLQGTGRDKVLVVDVSGLISRGGSVLFLPAEDVVEHVKARLAVAERDERIKAVILRVNSPGGTVTASDDIYKAVLEFKKKSGKPVVSLMGDTAASGGYYVSMACDRVVAHEATLTGSIGVIMQFLNYKGLFEKYGLRWQTITPADADLKSIGAGDRDMTEKERQVFQSMIEEMYTLFLERVKAGRKNLTAEKIRELADGRPYTGKQAFEAGLVDALGDLDTALEEARKIRSFARDAVVIELRTVTPFSSLFGMRSAAPAPALSAADIGHALENTLGARFYFLYQR